MEELVKHINDTNASYRALNAGDAKNTDLFLDNEHYELFKDSGDIITVRFNKENLSKAILFIASILPRKYDNSAVHKKISYSPAFVLDQLAFLDGFFSVDGKKVETRTQKWNARKDVMKANGEIDKRFYFNGLLEDITYISYKGERKSAKFTIRNYFAGGYSDLHIKKANDGIFDIWITNAQTPYDDGKDKHHEIIDDQTPTLQQIFYGAPGTGKSDTIFERTKDLPKEDVYRTTFHPDSDYASFVGSYKPKMNDRTVYGAQGPLRNSRGEEISEPKITYTFSPQAFTNAYIRAWQTDEPVFLIIEEINRGNCAQIFGDLFQLLDRDENGYSKYDIVPDSDLSDYIKGKLEDAAEKEGLTSHIKEGKILKLPNNLYIWATMNTSDQSLFPIDSAFKRRWEWKYIKIKKGIDKKTGAELDWKIKVGEDNSYDWWEFLKAINYKIDKMTSSADKQLGYFFCLADRNGEINIDTFVNKVAFYLWNDVFKDYAEDGSPLLKYKKNEEDKSESDLTFPDFFDQSGKIDKNVVKQFIEKVMKEDDMDKPAE